MKKLYLLAVSLLTMVSANAQINPDTTYYPKFENGSWTAYTPYNNQTYRYMFGTNNIGHVAKACVVLPNDSLHPKKEHLVQGIGFKTKKRGPGGGPTSVVKYQIYELDGNGLPSTVLAEVDVPWSDFKNEGMTWGKFATPLTFQATDSYAIGYNFSTLASSDTISGYVSQFGEVTYAGIGMTFEQEGTTWRRVNSGFSPFGEDVSLYAKIAYAEIDTAVSIQKNDRNFSLSQNFPNPANNTTTVSYSLPNASAVNFEVYDVSGRLVESKNESFKPAGVHTIVIDANNYTQGLYFYVLKANGQSATRKMSIVK